MLRKNAWTDRNGGFKSKLRFMPTWLKSYLPTQRFDLFQFQNYHQRKTLISNRQDISEKGVTKAMFERNNMSYTSRTYFDFCIGLPGLMHYYAQLYASRLLFN